MQIYITTNLINSKIYIGQSIHSNKNYLGSGVKLKKAIDKYGTENFKKEILLEVNTQEELDAAEIYFIKEYNSTDPIIGYNLNQGGQYESRTSTKLHEETKRKISKSLTGYKHSEKSKLKMSKRSSGSNNGMYNKGEKVSGEKNGRYNGNGTTDETRRKLSEAKKGITLSPETREKISEKSSGTSNGMYGTCAYKMWVKQYGKEEADKRNNEKKLKISNAQKGKKMTEEHKRKISEARKHYWTEKKKNS